MACSTQAECRERGDTLLVGALLPHRPYQTAPDGSAATSSHLARGGLGGLKSARPRGQTTTPPAGTLMGSISPSCSAAPGPPAPLLDHSSTGRR